MFINWKYRFPSLYSVDRILPVKALENRQKRGKDKQRIIYRTHFKTRGFRMETAQILNEYATYMFGSLGRASEIHSSAALHEKTLL